MRITQITRLTFSELQILNKIEFISHVMLASKVVFTWVEWKQWISNFQIIGTNRDAEKKQKQFLTDINIMHINAH